MAEGRQRHQWEMNSALMALVAAVGGDKDATPQKFNPFEAGTESDEPEEISMATVCSMFRSL